MMMSVFVLIVCLMCWLGFVGSVIVCFVVGS